MNMTIEKLIGLKSHDYHIIMERLLLVMFQGYFDDVVWMVLVDLSYFYRQICPKNNGRDDRKGGERDNSASMQDEEKISLWIFQSNATSPYTSYI
jgi:hypothetical protein